MSARIMRLSNRGLEPKVTIEFTADAVPKRLADCDRVNREGEIR